MNYSLSSARASLPFSELTRIKIPKPTPKETKKIKSLERTFDRRLAETDVIKGEIRELAGKYIHKKR